jgi:hypothetical protein
MSATVTQALQAALTPKTGMQRIPFPLESYQHTSPPLSSKRLLNLYAEQEPADARTAAALIPTPGLQASGTTLGSGPILALNGDIPGYTYAVSGTRFFRYTSPTTVEDLGDIGSPTTPDFAWHLMPTIAVGVNAAVVCIPPRAYTCAHDGPLNQITGDFPGARSVTYLNGYFVFTSDSPLGPFFVSGLLDPTAYDALDFAYPDGEPDALRRVMTLNGELWLIGDSSLEVWYDAGSSGLETSPGTSFFPFRRRAGGVIEHGALSIRTCVIADGSLFWLSHRGIVMRTVGYQPQRISTHAIEQIIRLEGASQIELALSYLQDGHCFYCLQFSDRTLVYDCTTKAWHERASSADGTGRWRPSAAVETTGLAVLGDSLSGQLLFAEPYVGTDMGLPVLRQFITPPLWAGTAFAFCSRLEIECEVALVPDGVTLDWSDDGGYTWVGTRQLRPTTTWGNRIRMYTTRLGSFRQRMFRVTTMDRVPFYAVDANIASGTT